MSCQHLPYVFLDAYLTKDQLVRSLSPAIIYHGSVIVLRTVFNKMKVFEQQKYLNAIIASLSKQYLNTGLEIQEASVAANPSFVAAVASFINELVETSDALKDYLVTALVRSAVPPLEDSFGARRSVIAALTKDEG